VACLWGPNKPRLPVAGHGSITTTLIYLEVLPDPTGYMDKVT